MTAGSKACQPKGPRSRLLLALAAAAALGLAASACGGSSGQGVARVDSNATTTGASSQSRAGRADPTRYAACMRKNGVPKFPDPDANGRFNISGGPGLDPNSPQFKAADKACQKYMPQGGGKKPSQEQQAKGLQEALEYSACMRKNGVPKFPDPKANAEGGMELNGEGTGVDWNSPRFKAAQTACKDLAPGANGGAVNQSPAPGAKP